jgi:hypothetical protein
MSINLPGFFAKSTLTAGTGLAGIFITVACLSFHPGENRSRFFIACSGLKTSAAAARPSGLSRRVRTPS